MGALIAIIILVVVLDGRLKLVRHISFDIIRQIPYIIAAIRVTIPNSGGHQIVASFKLETILD